MFEELLDFTILDEETHEEKAPDLVELFKGKELLLKDKSQLNDKEQEQVKKMLRDNQQKIIDLYNAEIRPLQPNQMACLKCGNKRQIQSLDENGFVVTKICDCVQAMKDNHDCKTAHFTDDFDSFVVYEKWQQDVLNKARIFARQHNSWWFIGGQCGAGKTHICTVIGNELIREHKIQTYRINWSDFIQKVKNRAVDGDVSRLEQYLNKAIYCDVLYIDDLLKTYSQADINYLFQIINARYVANRITMISSEKTIEQIAEIDEAIASRIVEKCTKDFVLTIARDKTKNWRLR